VIKFLSFETLGKPLNISPRIFEEEKIHVALRGKEIFWERRVFRLNQKFEFDFFSSK